MPPQKKKVIAYGDITIHHTHAFEANTLQVLVHAIHALKGPIMSAISDLRDAVAASNTATAADLDALNVAMTAEMQRITAALATIPNQDPAIVEVTTMVQTAQASLHAGLTSAVDALNAEVPDAPPAP